MGQIRHQVWAAVTNAVAPQAPASATGPAAAHDEGDDEHDEPTRRCDSEPPPRLPLALGLHRPKHRISHAPRLLRL